MKISERIIELCEGAKVSKEAKKLANEISLDTRQLKTEIDCDKMLKKIDTLAHDDKITFKQASELADSVYRKKDSITQN